MHPGNGTCSESLADIILNKHIMPLPARNGSLWREPKS